jgi:hypothetical protein
VAVADAHGFYIAHKAIYFYDVAYAERPAESQKKNLQ